MTPEAAFAPPKDDTVRIVPLGGCGEFGMNLTAYMTAGKLFVVDAGVMFPDPMRLGVDVIVPKVDHFFAAVGGPFAYIITHAHEDHVGAVPHLMRRWPAPVYTTPWTHALLMRKLERKGGPDDMRVVKVEAGDRVATEGFEAQFLHVNHSIPMACALAIKAGRHKILHTGDFKCDEAPLGEPLYDLKGVKDFAGAGIDLMLADSTNAHKEGRCPGERSVLNPLVDVIRASSGACFLTTFASNLWRLNTIAQAAHLAGRRLVISGAGMEQTLSIGAEMGLLNLPLDVLIDEEQAKGLKREELCILATGCQGEYRAALYRMTMGENKGLNILPGDTVVFSSRIIPGNERAVLSLGNKLSRLGARMLTTREVPGIHVSGHGYREDLEILLKAARPNTFLPVHGAFPHLKANQELGERLGIPRTELIENGDVLELQTKKLTRLGRVETDVDFVDAESGVLITREILRERLKVGELGAVVVTGAFDRKRRQWILPPTLKVVGFALPVYIDAASFEQEILVALDRAVQESARKGASDDEIREEARIALRRRYAQVLNKKPVVWPELRII